MKKFEVSVVIPVYNAEKFISNAVNSALEQSEVVEVILVDDGSTDHSLEICNSLKEKNKKIKLLQHLNGENLGAGASRNLGIKESKSPFIAFLDVDDWYLEGRFKEAKKVFEKELSADGVYDAVGTYFVNEEARKKWFKYYKRDITAPNKKIEPNNLLKSFILDRTGHFHTNGITLKKTVFEKVGYFDTELEISQDTHLWIRLAAACNIYPGNIYNVKAIRRVHDGNRWSTTKERINKFRKIKWEKLDKWVIKQDLSISKKAIIHLAYLVHKSDISRESINLVSLLSYIKNFSVSFVKKPILSLVTFSLMFRIRNKND